MFYFELTNTKSFTSLLRFWFFDMYNQHSDQPSAIEIQTERRTNVPVYTYPHLFSSLFRFSLSLEFGSFSYFKLCWQVVPPHIRILGTHVQSHEVTQALIHNMLRIICYGYIYSLPCINLIKSISLLLNLLLYATSTIWYF